MPHDLPLVTTIAAEATFPIAGVAPGTTSFMSALHPDAAAPQAPPLSKTYEAEAAL